MVRARLNHSFTHVIPTYSNLKPPMRIYKGESYFKTAHGIQKIRGLERHLNDFFRLPKIFCDLNNLVRIELFTGIQDNGKKFTATPDVDRNP